jgi:hypothetical protein
MCPNNLDANLKVSRAVRTTYYFNGSQHILNSAIWQQFPHCQAMLAIYANISSAARQMNISYASIYKGSKGIINRAGGYMWSNADEAEARTLLVEQNFYHVHK